MRTRVAALALLVLLAGCGGTVGSTDTAEPTVTPAPVPGTPEDGPRPTPDFVSAPGIGQTGVVNAGALVGAHATVLGRTSFTAYINSTRRLPNGTVQSRYERRIQFAAEKDRFYYVLEQMDRRGSSMSRRTIERWSGGQRVVQLSTVGDRRTSRILRDTEPSRSFPENATNRVDLYRLFTVVDTELVEVFERGGTTEFHLVGGPQRVPPLRNVTLRAVVDERGVITEYTVAYTVGPEPIRVVVSARYERIGTTRVARPHWVVEID